MSLTNQRRFRNRVTKNVHFSIHIFCVCENNETEDKEEEEEEAATGKKLI